MENREKNRPIGGRRTPPSRPSAACPRVFIQSRTTPAHTSTAMAATTVFRFHLALIGFFLLQIITAILPR